jgi:hypothetical protein
MQRNSHHLSQMNQNREGNLASVLPHHRRSRLCFCHHKITIQSTMRDVDFANYVKSVYQRCYKIILLKKKAKKKTDWRTGRWARRRDECPKILCSITPFGTSKTALQVSRNIITRVTIAQICMPLHTVLILSLSHTPTH